MTHNDFLTPSEPLNEDATLVQLSELQAEMEQLHSMKAEMQPALDTLKRQEQRVKELATDVISVGDKFSHSGVELTHRKGYNRNS